jgi:hypothetical protein
MRGSILWIMVLLVGLFVLKVASVLARRFFVRWVAKVGLEAVGQIAMDRQPDRITLVPRAEPPPPEVQAMLRELAQLGYQPAGSFRIPELGLPVSFMLEPAEAAGAAIYEHPKAGVWLDLFTRYQDGTSFSLATTAAGSGMDRRPGHPVVRAPGLDPAAAHARFLRERTAGAMRQISADQLPGVFIDAYAEHTAWRKRRGVSSAEVARVAAEKIGPPPRRSARL